MQWHPIFMYLERPILQAECEITTPVPVGDLPREADIVGKRRTAGPPPFQGMWRWQTLWNLVDNKGRTVSARLQHLNELVELGLGIHRRLNSLEVSAGRPERECQETTWWYLAHDLGSRFLPAAARLLSQDLVVLAPGMYQATVLGHPLILVSGSEVAVDRDSLPLHLLNGVEEHARQAVVNLLLAEPELTRIFASWLAMKEPLIWKEVCHMVEENEEFTFDYLRWVTEFGLDHLVRNLGTKEFIEKLDPRDIARAVGSKVVDALGTKQVVAQLDIKEVVSQLDPQEVLDALGTKQVVARLGIDKVLAELPPEQLDALAQRHSLPRQSQSATRRTGSRPTSLIR